MQIRIYQINSERDCNQVKFRGLDSIRKLQKSSKVNASLYDNVFDAEMDDMSLQEVFERFNHEKHPLYRGHSLSVSDVVVMNGEAFICDDFGFQKIEFDEEVTQKPDNLMKILYVEPHRKPFVTEILNTLEAQQQTVKGRIEYIINDDKTIFVVNEEHKINGMEGNRRIEGDVIAGPFFVVGDTGESVCSLTDEQIEKYAKRFEKPEDISEQEIFEHLIRPTIFVQSM